MMFGVRRFGEINMGEFATQIGRVSGVSKAFQFKLPHLMALLAGGSQGFTPEQTATGINAMIQNFTQKQGLVRGMGKEFGEALDNSDLLELLRLLRDRTAEMGGVEKFGLIRRLLPQTRP